MSDDKEVSDLAHAIANHWMRDRIHFADALRRCGPQLQAALDALEKMTRGDDRRCFCLRKGKNSGHDMMCPASKSRAGF